MRREIHKWQSQTLTRPTEMVLYGHYGWALLLFPTWAADCYVYERYGVVDAIAEPIAAGQLKVYSVNSVDAESWMAEHIPPRDRAVRQIQYSAYITQEVVPFIQQDCRGPVPIVACGADMGAFYAANEFFKRPDLFRGLVAMSGSYDLKLKIPEDYFDDNCYYNSPVHYLPNLPQGPILDELRRDKEIHLLCGQGQWEDPDESRRLAWILKNKGIPHNLDLWGTEMTHDWPTWRQMLRHYVGRRLNLSR